jgi:tetratricopeptide (TPR) repeat protein
MNCPLHWFVVTVYKTNFHFASFFLLFLGLIVSPAIAQSDDLERKLENMPDDTVKVNVLLQLGKHYCSLENDKALMFLQEAFTLATAENYEAGIGKSLLWQGRVYYYKDDYPIAIKYLEKSKPFLEKVSDKENLAFNHFALGEIHRIRGDYVQALNAYDHAITLAEKSENLKCISSYYASIGRIHLERKEAETAMSYFRKSLKQKQTINDEPGISNIFTCIGLTYEELGILDSALICHNKALEIRKSLKNERTIAGSEYNIGGILVKLERYQEAETSLQIAIENFSNLDEKTGIIISTLRLATARSKQNKPDAIELATSALKMAQKIDNPNLIGHAYEILSDIYYETGDYESSHYFLKKHMVLEDSIFNTEKERLLVEFEKRFQSERKDREIEFYRSENKIQDQNIMLLAVLLIASLIFVVLLFYFFRIKSTALKRHKLLLEKEQVIHSQESKLAEKENQLLQEKLEAKNRELASKALEMIRLNDTITHIIEKLDLFKNSVNQPEDSKHIKEIIHDLENQTKQNIWNEFNQIFKNIHSDFYSKLLEICPDLTATEIKTAALLKLNLTTKEIAALSFKSEGGVKTTRYRLRKKLNLGSDEKLIPFLMQI